MPDLSHTLPYALGLSAGAGYGAYRKPGGSRSRGAVIGGAGGLGAAAGLSLTNALLKSPQAEFVASSPGVAAATALGGAGLGLSAGLHGGRELADALGFSGRKNNNPDNDLEEIDPTSTGKGNLRSSLTNLLLNR